MQSDFLIIGQGIAGSLLYYCLSKAGANCIVVEENKPNSASRVAAGLINPVTGRRLVKSWMIDDLIPSFKNIYSDLEKEYSIKCLFQTQLNWHLPATDIVEAFEKRIQTRTEFLAESDHIELSRYFNFPFKAGTIQPCFIVDVQLILDSIRMRLEYRQQLLNEKFQYDLLLINESGVEYKGIRARKIIFCEGAAGVTNPWFAKLPYSLNKGEALLIRIKDLPPSCIYKFKQTLVPLPGHKNLWWYGSNYIWEFENDQPTIQYREASENELHSWLKLPFTIIEHKAAIRYATVERRPFVGFHPTYANVGIFNGWGSKGCSLVPFFAQQFAKQLIDRTAINPEVDVRRFSNVLVKG